jgi:hypothetical protein
MTTGAAVASTLHRIQVPQRRTPGTPSRHFTTTDIVTKENIMRKLLRLVLALSVLGALIAVPGAGVAFANDNLHNYTGTFQSTIDCSRDPYSITATYNQVIHLSNGRFKLAQTGSFVAVPVDTGQTASGHYAFSINEVDNADGSVTGTDAFNLTGEYADGTPFRFHYQEQWKGATPTSIIKSRLHDSCPA